jgi:hypothetical protein
MSFATQTVEVNFNINVDATGELSILSYKDTAPTNIITSQVNLPVTALYDPNNNRGLIEYFISKIISNI